MFLASIHKEIQQLMKVILQHYTHCTAVFIPDLVYVILASWMQLLCHPSSSHPITTSITIILNGSYCLLKHSLHSYIHHQLRCHFHLHQNHRHHHHQRHSIGTTSVQYAHWFLREMSEEVNQVITSICEEQCMLNYKVNMALVTTETTLTFPSPPKGAICLIM